jgi:ParB/RepB/Spo0J family partition protein
LQKKIESINLTQIREPQDPQRLNISRESIEALAMSMNSRGQLQPIGVVKKDEFYEIEYGHRRFLAAQLLNWDAIDCIVFNDSEEATLHLNRAHENIHRENLNPVEEAKDCWRLVYEQDRGVEATAALMCKPVSWVEGRLDILRYPPEIIQALQDGKIKMSVAKELSRVKDLETRQRLLESAAQYGATAPTVAKWIADISVSAFLENKEIQEKAGQIQAASMGQVTMQCFGCQERYVIDYLSHIWVCPQCRAAIYQLQQAIIQEMTHAKAQPENNPYKE